MSSSSVRGWRRVPGPASTHSRLFVVAALAAVAAACAVGLILAGGRGKAPAASTYGSLPSWLPKADAPVGRVLRASAGHAPLAVQGDTVSIQLDRGHVLATVVGPEVPEDGRFPVPPTSPCRFTVTFTAPSGTIPLDARAFTILDELGHLHHPHVTTADGGALPARLSPGRTLALAVSDVLPTGGGQLRWAPETTEPVSSWDFDVEID